MMLRMKEGSEDEAELVVPDPEDELFEGAEPPPAAEESWANPTDGGDEARNTVYTFLRKVSPTTQEGFSPPDGILLPMFKSKIAPMH